jgi:hypothetical protein
MPVVTMMLIGGQRSLTAAASFSPSMEPGRSTSVEDRVNVVAELERFDRIIGIGHSNNVVALGTQPIAGVYVE